MVVIWISSQRPKRPSGVLDDQLLAIFTGTHGNANGLDGVLNAAAVLCNDLVNNCTWYFEPDEGDNHDARTRDQAMDGQA